jgi:LysR family transcriptional regulator, regulator of abg operon
MKLEQLEIFVAIVEHGSLRAAARRLGQLQPALSRNIGALEKDLGEVLFSRHSSGMTLTPQGQRFHLRAASIVNEARRAREEIKANAGLEVGSVVMGLSIMPHVGMLPYALKNFYKKYPKAKVQVIEGLFPDVEHGLRTGAIDFYIGAAPRNAPAPGLTQSLLFSNTRALVCRKDHPKAAAKSMKFLSQVSWAITALDYNAEDDLRQLLTSMDLPAPTISFRASSAMSMMVALASTDMVAMLPVQWKAFEITKNVLQVIKVREPLPAPNIVMIRRTGLLLTPAAEHMCDLLLRFSP